MSKLFVKVERVEDLIGRVDDYFTQPKRKPKPIKTNGDRIRAMSDEELAEYLDGVCHDLWQMFVKDPQKMWLDWLRQEEKENKND